MEGLVSSGFVFPGFTFPKTSAIAPDIPVADLVINKPLDLEAETGNIEFLKAFPRR